MVRVALVWGLAFLMLISVVVNLVAPLRSLAAVGVTTGLSLAGLIWFLCSSRARRALILGWHRVPLWIWILSGVAVVALAVGSSLTPTHYDFGLYHYAGVRFAAQYATIPGLGNLISYLGYANSETTLAALLENGPAGPFGFQALNGALALLLLADCLVRFMTRPTTVGTYVSAVITGIVWVVSLVFADQFIASPTSDTAVFILVTLSISAFADVIGRGRVTGASISLAVVPLLVATTMRPQILLLLVGIVLVVLLIGSRRGWGRGAGPSWVAVGILGVIAAAAMTTRDFFLTARAVFPLSLWTWNVPWLTEDPSELRRITIAIARDPSSNYQSASDGFGWLPTWILSQIHHWEAFLVLLLFVLIAVTMVGLKVGARRIPIRSLCLLVAPGVVFLAAWVGVLPPTWRHAYGAAFATLGGVLAYLIFTAGVRASRVLAVSLTVVALTGVVCMAVRYPIKMAGMPDAPTRELILPSGLRVLVPTRTDQCWENELLCTPMPSTSLRLLGPTLQDGFSVMPG